MSFIGFLSQKQVWFSWRLGCQTTNNRQRILFESSFEWLDYTKQHQWEYKVSYQSCKTKNYKTLFSRNISYYTIGEVIVMWSVLYSLDEPLTHSILFLPPSRCCQYIIFCITKHSVIDMMYFVQYSESKFKQKRKLPLSLLATVRHLGSDQTLTL